MRNYAFNVISALLISLPLFSCAQGTPQIVEKIDAIVSDKIILHSEVEDRYQEYLVDKNPGINSRCRVLEDFLYEKLLLIEAEKDSTITVSDDQVDQEFQKRMNYYLEQFGSKEAFEKFYGKTVEQFKEELKPDVKNLLLAQQMRSKIIENLTVSPEDIRKYYESIPSDSVPFINAQEQVAQILILPNLSEEEKKLAKDKADELRERVVKGESMATLAILYSDDPGSAKKGGEYIDVKRGEFVPEFEKVAYSLSDGEVSQVFETQYGYHFIQLIHRHGELVDLRHILVVPKVTDADLEKAKEKLDSIRNLILKDSISFSDAAAQFSEDKNTKFNGGTITNPQTGSSHWDMEQLGQLDLSNTAFMSPGDITQPEAYTTLEAKQAYRIVLLKERTKPHKANMKDDYQLLQNAALNKKQMNKVNGWISRKLKDGVYVHIDKEYDDCHFQNNWLNP